MNRLDMNIKHVLCSAIIAIFTTVSTYADNDSITLDSISVNSEHVSVRTYMYLRKYAKEYRVPIKYAYSIAYLESTYRGPLDMKYNPYLASKCGAVGPMQLMPKTASSVAGYRVQKHVLKKDIRLNIELSMKLLRELHDKHQSWPKAIGAYRSGRPIITPYVRKILRHEYKWIR